MKIQERQVYRDTYELFDGCCALCGSPFIQMHHIRYGAVGRKTYMGNVIPLCKKHHDLVHTNKKLYMDQLIEIINKKMGE
jgi:5-methylcytosine-specific restriction endonuclease McrA